MQRISRWIISPPSSEDKSKTESERTGFAELGFEALRPALRDLAKTASQIGRIHIGLGLKSQGRLEGAGVAEESPLHLLLDESDGENLSPYWQRIPLRIGILPSLEDQLQRDLVLHQPKKVKLVECLGTADLIRMDDRRVY